MNPFRPGNNHYDYLESESGTAMPGEEGDTFIAYQPVVNAPSNPQPSRLEFHAEDSRDRRSSSSPSMHLSNKKIVFIAAVIAACVGIALGVIIGWFSSQAQMQGGQSDVLKEGDVSVRKLLMDEMKAKNIKEYLRLFTSTPHLAGTPADKKNADYVRDEWVKYGLRPVRQNAYNVLLSYPDNTQPNRVTVLNSNGTTFSESKTEEPPLDGETIRDDVVKPFNAYAAAGTIENELVYVNYGRVEDFQLLERTLGVNVTGKIAIARYGKIFRGDKVKQAEIFGAIGLILYSDPADYAVGGISSVYPDSWWLPGYGVQRGSLFITGVGGDPLTPGYPSLDGAFREDESSVGLPNIPVQPIGYDDAKIILRKDYFELNALPASDDAVATLVRYAMEESNLGYSTRSFVYNVNHYSKSRALESELEGGTAPSEWQGGLSGLTYKLGPTLQDNKKVKLEVFNTNVRRTTYNVIGMIPGSVEPDRYVIVGNHRDAWVFGAVDPSSGTAVLMELARAMGKLYKEGRFQPRRSIVFCSWGAEEYSLIGSTEWVEEFAKTLGKRAVAYLNVDISVQGNYTFRAKATPNLFSAIYEATKQVPDVPIPGHLDTVYDTWAHRKPWSSDNPLPHVSNVGSGSDYAAFLGEIGISSVDLRYDYNTDLNISSYPLYHSMYETFRLVSEIMDPDFHYHLAVSRVWGELARSLADSVMLPFDCRTYVTHLQGSITTLKTTYADKMLGKGITFDAIDAGMTSLTKAAEELHTYIEGLDSKNPFEVRKINDQLMYMDRAFTDPHGLPGRPLQRHVAFAPSSKDSYYGDAFPGIMDLMFDIENSADPEAQWEAVRKHMSVVAYTLHSVATTLTDVNVLGIQPS